DEAMRTKAENLVARAQGVKKVVDELSLGDTPVVAAAAAPPLPDGQLPPDQQAGPAGQVLQSDGTYAPATADQAAPPAPAQTAPQYQQGPPPPPDARQPIYPQYPQAYAPGPNGPRGVQQA